TSPDPTPAEKAAATADMVEGVVPKPTPEARAELSKKFEEQSKERAGVTGRTVDEIKEAARKEAKFRPYVTGFFEDPTGVRPFYEPEWVGAGQLHVNINKSHPFFEHLYSATLNGGEHAARMKYGLDVMLFMLAKAEMSTENEDTAMLYEAQRKGAWSTFLR